MTTTRRFVSSDLEAFPDDDDQRYEIIGGELYVSKQPHFNHQRVCSRLDYKLQHWIEQGGNGHVAVAPGVIFAEDDDVAPDLVWLSADRMAKTLEPDGKLHGAPELIVEVLSPGAANEKRDREAKLLLYSRRGVDEYWIVDWRRRRIEVFRPQEGRLALVGTLDESSTLTSPLLPSFTCPVASVFSGISPDA